jgi:hypothetical protein
VSSSTQGLPLSEAEHQVQDHHPGWHVWHSDTICWASCACRDGGGRTLDAPTPELLDQVIAEYEHTHRLAA